MLKEPWVQINKREGFVGALRPPLGHLYEGVFLSFLIVEQLHILFTVQTARRTSMRVWESALCPHSNMVKQRTAEDSVDILIRELKYNYYYFKKVIEVLN